MKMRLKFVWNSNQISLTGVSCLLTTSQFKVIFDALWVFTNLQSTPSPSVKSISEATEPCHKDWQFSTRVMFQIQVVLRRKQK